ncbi:hypothetical protein ACOMHN_023632 [Nucella lapillus]
MKGGSKKLAGGGGTGGYSPPPPPSLPPAGGGLGGGGTWGRGVGPTPLSTVSTERGPNPRAEAELARSLVAAADPLGPRPPPLSEALDSSSTRVMWLLGGRLTELTLFCCFWEGSAQQRNPEEAVNVRS